MDLVNKVTVFERFMMTDPDEASWWNNLKKARTFLAGQNFLDGEIYPAGVVESGKPPRCIFIPDKNLLRKMI